jgi:putative N6-adenine-specific DNA methylase
MADPGATRGARKLLAAFERFALGARVRGARALDVGASTGGFTATMLAQGAREVTAIDVGAGQLAAALRDDRRVHVLERTDFRRASLSLAPGPFDFFSVDVSFMAARNVLRPLAFRLRDGAEGVVLLKPQFELPKSRVQGGEVRDPNARREALARFAARATELGFSVLAQIDWPVAGGSGSIEMLLHLRFAGRTAKLPAPGEQRGQPAGGKTRPNTAKRKRQEHATVEGPLRWFAVAAPGLEAALASELQAIAGLENATAVAGGVEFSAPLLGGFAANLHSRIATRVLLRLGEIDAREFAVLRRRAGPLPFERWLSPELPVRIDVATSRCRLYHTAAIAETVLLAASDRLGAPLQAQRARANDGADDSDARDEPADQQERVPADREPAGGPSQEPFARLLVRGHEDRFVLSLDTSGALLHRRGARLETGRAPLRETLAAGILRLAGYDGSEPLVNAMCGAGTIALEAAAIALAHAPGRQRSFALERFPQLNQDAAARDAIAQQRAQAQAAERAEPSAPLFAFDRDAAAIARAKRNAERAQVASALSFQHAELAAVAPPCASGLLIANPPYGRRLGSQRQARAGYGELVRVLRQRWRGFRVALLVPRDAPGALGLRSALTYPLQNGGIPVTLVVATL